jgi:hypothetical protein
MYECECGNCYPNTVAFSDDWIIDFRGFIEKNLLLPEVLIIKVCDKPVDNSTVAVFDSDYFKLLMRKVDWEYFNAII